MVWGLLKKSEQVLDYAERESNSPFFRHAVENSKDNWILQIMRYNIADDIKDLKPTLNKQEKLIVVTVLNWLKIFDLWVNKNIQPGFQCFI